MTLNQTLLAIGLIAVALFLVKKANKTAIENIDKAYASGNFGIAYCQGNSSTCKQNCDRMNGDWIPGGGSTGNGGCYCYGCEGKTWGGCPTKSTKKFNF